MAHHRQGICCLSRASGWGLAGVALLLALPQRAAEGGVMDLLFVVANPASLTSGESTRKTQFESWGYTVTLIDDGDSQSNFNAAAAANNVAYVSLNVSDSTLGTKLKNVAIGVVNEHHNLADEFGIASSSIVTASDDEFDIKVNSHYITYGLSITEVFVLTSNQSLSGRSGTLASGATNLAEVEDSSNVDRPGLLVIDVGGSLYGGGSAAGRRVHLPFGSTSFSFSALNSTGLQIVQRSIEWAARPNPAIGNLLMVVTSSSSPTTQETLRRMILECWGYNVTLLSASATQSSYDSALSGKSVVYVNEDISASDTGTKLVGATIGVVCDETMLTDEFGFSTSQATTSGSSITIAENSHPITSGFSTGSVSLFSSSQTLGRPSGTLAPGLQTLGTISGNSALAVLEKGAVLASSGTAAGRRVSLPWNDYNTNALTPNGKKLLRQALSWAAATPGTRLLMPVLNSSGLTAQELARKTLLETWGYAVNILDDDAAQASYNTACGANTVVFIPEEIVSGSLGTKLVSAQIGIVSEEPELTDEFQFSTSGGSTTGTAVTIVNGTHYITSPFGLGSTTILSSSQPVITMTGSFAPEMQLLAQWGSSRALAAFEAGAKLADGSTAAGRRVQLPWGGDAFDFNALNANGRTMLQRSLKWAGALIGHWRFDETSGTTAADSSGYGHNGTLSGSQSFSSHATTGKLGGALQFNGTSHYVTAASTSTLQLTSAMTITAWIKGDAWDTGTFVNTILRKGEANPNNYQLAVCDGKLEMLLDGDDNSGYKANTTLQTGVWYHVAATWDGSTVRLYVNGALDNNPPPSKSAPIGTDSRALYLGGRSGSTDFFRGALDDVRLYNYAMDAAEIDALSGMGQAQSGVRILKWVEVP